ncbi:hypothetical protein NliqN6_2148 [Naganishia liquefaciens]|uniref:ABM domain-containing protein n=1 Tax=Naganishia liquefaciens TaxID=104408 RepID=A0A8H3TRQ8_9TREE|nr:hypothetical protein NliqN6_2148 [Naganishia liquefaciens]
MTITLHAKVVAKPEHAEAVKKQLLTVKDAADNKEEGTLLYRVNQKKSDKNTFILFEEYKDLAALDAHKAGPEFQALAAKATEWFAEPLVLDLLEPSKL